MREDDLPVSRAEFENSLLAVTALLGETNLLVCGVISFLQKKGFPIQEYWDGLDQDALEKWRKMKQETMGPMNPSPSRSALKLVPRPQSDDSA